MPILIPTDQNGRGVNDPLGHFKISESDDNSDPQYYGYVSMHGAWYIHKISSAGVVHRYAQGASGYPAAWANRVSIGYDYFNVVF